jgi:hypothetical protein
MDDKVESPGRSPVRLPAKRMHPHRGAEDTAPRCGGHRTADVFFYKFYKFYKKSGHLPGLCLFLKKSGLLRRGHRNADVFFL